MGTGRAGTTLLRRLLQSSQQIHIPPEIWSFNETYQYFLTHRSRVDWEHLVPTLVHSYISKSMLEDDFRHRACELTESLTSCPPDQRSFAYLINAINRAHGRFKGADFTCWGDKTPLNSYHASKIVRVFPDARFIHLIRDPVDVLYSYLDRGLFDDLPSAVDRWRSSIKAVQDFSATSDAVFDVRYEDLVSEPESTVASVTRFLDVQMDEDAIRDRDHLEELSDIAWFEHFEHVSQPISTEHVGKGRREFSPDTLRRLHRHLGDACQKLGYEPILQE